MRKVIILIPIFNDWESLEKLISEIDESVDGLKEYLFDCFIINDASSIETPKLKKPKNLNSIKIFNMKENKGHARCNAFGIRYVNNNENFDYLILMDGDGEDRPAEIKNLVDRIKKNPNYSVVAKRIKRSEGNFFQFLYFFHKLITLIFTGKKINFGNYSCLNKNDVQIISTKASLWSSYSGTIKKYIKNYKEVDSIRGSRYFGPSKMSIGRLILHSFSIIAVFKYQVLFRSFMFFLAIYYFKNYFEILSHPFVCRFNIFNLMIFTVSLREKKDELFKSQENLKNIEEISH